jgi:hypothetical protein
MKTRVHILSAVNASNVSKTGSTYTIKDVCGAVDGIVMNSALYPAEELKTGVSTMNGKPAPAGHPKDGQGRFISALNGEALLNSYIGSICTNARHEGGRSLFDIVVNEAQAKAHPEGQKLVERLDAAINGQNADPIHVSTGLVCKMVTANGESGGKKYNRIATGIEYDHLAILLNQSGAGTPEQGVGMFLNSEGQEVEVESVNVSTEPVDRRFEGVAGWLRKLLGNSDLSFEQIYDGLRAVLPEGAWAREVFSKSVIYVDKADKLYRQDYAVDSTGSVALLGQPVEVVRKVEYEPITNSNEVDAVKDKILAALNAAGIKTEGLDESQLLTAYNALVTKPVEDKLTAANSKIAEFEMNQRAAAEAEVKALAAELAVNSSLTVEDLQKLGLDRLKELKANSKAAPIVVTNQSGATQSEFAGYSLNSHLSEGSK